MFDDRSEGDQDSLFGSPPASPRQERSPSPGLALPSANTGVAKHNVGTIALPGSHIFSEYPMNPLAQASSNPPRPSVNLVQACSKAVSAHDHPTSSSSSSKENLDLDSKKKGKKKDLSRRSRLSPRPYLPQISIPDPSDPPPENFLKNQDSLLGIAGLVAGIKPAQLSRGRYSRGDSPKNPIVIEADRQPDASHLFSTCRMRKSPIPSQDPSPPLIDVVKVLTSQKNLLPVLQSLLKLISSSRSGSRSDGNAFASCFPLQPHTSPQNPFKKRKLHCVPAGAADWDVPFPFAHGEGPSEYRTNWEHERVKQICLQLVELIKSAFHTASVRASIAKADGGGQPPIAQTHAVPVPSSQSLHSRDTDSRDGGWSMSDDWRELFQMHSNLSGLQETGPDIVFPKAPTIDTGEDFGLLDVDVPSITNLESLQPSFAEALMSNPYEQSVKQSDRAELLKRATERRKELRVQINKVKRQLWETTVEQAILEHTKRKLGSA